MDEVRGPDIMVREDIQLALTKPVPKGWAEGRAFERAEMPEAIGEVLVKRIHQHLADATIGYVFREKMKTQGKTTLATASKAGGKLEFFTGIDLIIDVNWTGWLTLRPEQRVALIDHELCHFGAQMGENGIEYVMIHHDIEEFGGIVERWGFWKSDVLRFAEVCKQVDLFADLPSDASTSTITISSAGREPVTLTGKQLRRAAASVSRTH